MSSTAVSRPVAAAEADDVLIEFHFMPVPNLQVAIWLEDGEGNHVHDVYVTQATGTLGIGNRPGRWDFLSSYRFPYGPRTGVLPVWAHARGKTYPKLVFHDDDEADQDSLGWHENSSSPEPYFCRPLSESEHEMFSDAMTCPSPSGFQSDKGKFDPGTSIYPPRGDLVSFEDGHDHEDTRMFAEINDLDGVSGATPLGDMPELVTTMLPAELASRGPLTAHIEVHLENDQNEAWTFDREDDHYVDPRLSGFGIPYLGQPSVVYSVTFDPMERDFVSTEAYTGYGDLQGSSGELNPPDDTISNDGGSGADRLQLFTKNGRTFRFGAFSHGPKDGGDPDDSDWGSCDARDLPAMTGVELEPVDFDRIRVHFTVPQFGEETSLKNVRLFYRVGSMELTDDNASAAVQQVPTPDKCGAKIEPGSTTWCDVDQLFGSTDYQIGIRYEDNCSNASNLVADSITTPQQEFETVDGLCFIATAAYGAPWAKRVEALRRFRDMYLQQSDVGWALVQFYYHASPALARLIHRSPYARAVTRAHLEPVTNIARALIAGPPSGSAAGSVGEP